MPIHLSFDRRALLAVAAAAAVLSGACGSSGSDSTSGGGVNPPAPKTLTVTTVGSGTVTSSPAGMTCTGTVCSGTYADGVQVTLTATAAPGNRLTAWTGACAGSGSCTVVMDAPRSVTVTFVSKVESNGLTPDINKFVSDSLIKVLTAMGMTINRGATPPSIVGTYRMAPALLVGTTVPGESPGTVSSELLERFRAQDNDHLTIVSDYRTGPEAGAGIASFIVGTDSAFTVFGQFKTVAFGDTADNVEVITGKLSAGGMADMRWAALVLDNRGNPHGYYIPNNTGRVFRDQDGFSERTTDLDSLAAVARVSGNRRTGAADAIGGARPLGMLSRGARAAIDPSLRRPRERN